MNAKGQNQVSFIDRLNNRGVDPRSDTRIVQMGTPGKDKGGKGGSYGAWDDSWGGSGGGSGIVWIQLADGSYVQGMPVAGGGASKDKGKDKGKGKGMMKGKGKGKIPGPSLASPY